MIKLYLTDRGVEKFKFDSTRRGYQYAKGMLKIPHHDKKYPRYLLGKRVLRYSIS